MNLWETTTTTTTAAAAATTTTTTTLRGSLKKSKKIQNSKFPKKLRGSLCEPVEASVDLRGPPRGLGEASQPAKKTKMFKFQKQNPIDL